MEHEIGLKKPVIIFRLQKARTDEHLEILKQFLKMQILRVLHESMNTKIDDYQTLAEMNMNTTQLDEFKNAVQKEIGNYLQLPLDSINEKTTIQALVKCFWHYF